MNSKLIKTFNKIHNFFYVAEYINVINVTRIWELKKIEKAQEEF